MNYIEINYPNLKLTQRNEYSKISVNSPFEIILDKNKLIQDYNDCIKNQGSFFGFSDKEIHFNTMEINSSKLMYLFVPESSQRILCDNIMRSDNIQLNIEALFIPLNIKSIDCRRNFLHSHLKFLYIPPSVSTLCYTTLAHSKQISEVIIDGKIKEVPPNFLSDTTVNYVKLPNTVEYIHTSAFEHCAELKEIILPENLLYIKKFAFTGAGLNKIKIPDSVKGIDHCAFEGTSIKEVTIPKNVKRVCSYAFNTYYLENVILENIDDLDIHKNAFCNLHSANKLTITIKENNEEKALKWIKDNKHKFEDNVEFVIKKKKHWIT